MCLPLPQTKQEKRWKAVTTKQDIDSSSEQLLSLRADRSARYHPIDTTCKVLETVHPTWPTNEECLGELPRPENLENQHALDLIL